MLKKSLIINLILLANIFALTITTKTLSMMKSKQIELSELHNLTKNKQETSKKTIYNKNSKFIANLVFSTIETLSDLIVKLKIYNPKETEYDKNIEALEDADKKEIDNIKELAKKLGFSQKNINKIKVKICPDRNLFAAYYTKSCPFIVLIGKIPNDLKHAMVQNPNIKNAILIHELAHLKYNHTRKTDLRDIMFNILALFEKPSTKNITDNLKDSELSLRQINETEADLENSIEPDKIIGNILGFEIMKKIENNEAMNIALKLSKKKALINGKKYSEYLNQYYEQIKEEYRQDNDQNQKHDEHPSLDKRIIYLEKLLSSKQKEKLNIERKKIENLLSNLQESREITEEIIKNTEGINLISRINTNLSSKNKAQLSEFKKAATEIIDLVSDIIKNIQILNYTASCIIESVKLRDLLEKHKNGQSVDFNELNINFLSQDQILECAEAYKKQLKKIIL